ncbi:MAG: site-specific integrase [Muribaculaceae bacterium]|nr:site-specific integrase [Muribaculaceae bacterium]
MASIKIKYGRHDAAGFGAVYIQLIHERRAVRVRTGIRLHADEWDARHSRPVAPSLRRQLRADMERMAGIERRMEAAGEDYTAAMMADAYRRYMKEYSLTNFTLRVAAALKASGRVRTSETYRAALKSFMAFREGADVMMDTIDDAMMQAYEEWLRGRGLVPNTVSFYMRILRAVYNRAVDTGEVADRRPFRRVYTGVDRTVKRALSFEMVRRISKLDLSGTPALDYARDVFMLSFCLRGMSFVDLAFLRKTDLTAGRVVYRRRKTGQRLEIAWTREMQTIVEKYPENNSDYLLPILRRRGMNERCAYRNAGYRINRSLKKIGSMVGTRSPLTLYVARHSWATAAKDMGVPLGVISECMGHDSEATTRIYLASLDTGAVDRANSLILSSL